MGNPITPMLCCEDSGDDIVDILIEDIDQLAASSRLLHTASCEDTRIHTRIEDGHGLCRCVDTVYVITHPCGLYLIYVMLAHSRNDIDRQLLVGSTSLRLLTRLRLRGLLVTQTSDLFDNLFVIEAVRLSELKNGGQSGVVRGGSHMAPLSRARARVCLGGLSFVFPPPWQLLL